MSFDFWSAIPNLSIGVVSILALVYVTREFLKELASRSDKHERAMNDRESSLREVERDVRNNLIGTLSDATSAIKQNSHVMERVVRHLDTVK